ncbi:hypothetical protein AVEN_222808-1 [Araneus ventricosus]|uniref:Uncharacterized protein n=1 Tax=Araneus ventricosus TaxID=182803 RepID=A0A4Y2PT31_ARAVE|nr:hypothetical protein AVEN_122032-1 [Araneus ventricosus]GBN53720.1 hypothetical protein AVEN_141302-1 [Araneus ventricosus]GBN53762.1 hypothetical protein AVEN_222808-1 [Araneus ventricosus]
MGSYGLVEESWFRNRRVATIIYRCMILCCIAWYQSFGFRTRGTRQSYTFTRYEFLWRNDRVLVSRSEGRDNHIQLHDTVVVSLVEEPRFQDQKHQTIIHTQLHDTGLDGLVVESGFLDRRVTITIHNCKVRPQ